MPVPQRLLDADCGGGELLRELLARIPNCEAYTGVDAGVAGIHAARLASEPRITLACAAPQALPFPNNHFDLVLSGASLDRGAISGGASPSWPGSSATMAPWCSSTSPARCTGGSPAATARAPS